jgi:hypothetical protein
MFWAGLIHLVGIVGEGLDRVRPGIHLHALRGQEGPRIAWSTPLGLGQDTDEVGLGQALSSTRMGNRP